MGTITGTALIDKVAQILFDVNNVKWSRDELIRYVNDGQRALVSVLPETSATVTSTVLAAGTKQTIPSGSWMLLDVIRNMGTDGNTPGRAVQRVDMAILDESNPTWQSDASSSTTTVYMYNARDRQSFYVYPQSTGTNYLELVHSVYPTDQAEAAAIVVDDVYAPLLTDYILWRAYSKESEYANAQKGEQHYQLYVMALQANGASMAKLVAEQGSQTLKPPQGQGSSVIPPVTN